MVSIVAGLTLPAYASYRPPAPANNSEWDLLYVAAGLLLFVLVIAGAATMANHREDRGNPRIH